MELITIIKEFVDKYFLILINEDPSDPETVDYEMIYWKASTFIELIHKMDLCKGKVVEKLEQIKEKALQYEVASIATQNEVDLFYL